MAENLRSKHAFGSLANVDAAIASGAIDAYDILFLKEGKIGWIDKDGNKIIAEGKQQVVVVDALPEVGEEAILYVVNSVGYTWNGTEFKPIAEAAGGLDEAAIDEKIATAKAEAKAEALEEAKAYADEQISVEIVEF